MFENIKTYDPLNSSIFSLEELPRICDQNEIEAAQNSLNAELINWKDGKKVICRDWIKEVLEELSETADKFNMGSLLKPIYKVLDEGNQSIKWIEQYKKGLSIEEIIKSSILDMAKREENGI